MQSAEFSMTLRKTALWRFKHSPDRNRFELLSFSSRLLAGLRKSPISLLIKTFDPIYQRFKLSTKKNVVRARIYSFPSKVVTTPPKRFSTFIRTPKKENESKNGRKKGQIWLKDFNQNHNTRHDSSAKLCSVRRKRFLIFESIIFRSPEGKCSEIGSRNSNQISALYRIGKRRKAEGRDESDEKWNEKSKRSSWTFPPPSKRCFGTRKPFSKGSKERH